MSVNIRRNFSWHNILTLQTSFFYCRTTRTTTRTPWPAPPSCWAWRRATRSACTPTPAPGWPISPWTTTPTGLAFSWSPAPKRKIIWWKRLKKRLMPEKWSSNLTSFLVYFRFKDEFLVTSGLDRKWAYFLLKTAQKSSKFEFMNCWRWMMMMRCK